ncbi:MAG: hypothetical protein P1V20_10330 [Verrucomicrobiales bacterium]|nr:hypothetical protein [Verrucomicrobiales bacterium]
MGVMRGGKLVLIGVLSLLVIRKGGFSHFSALVALRAFFVLCTVNLLYAIAIGGEVFRGNYFIEYSINSSYTIAILVYMARPRLKLYDRILAWGFVVQCGSTTGMFVLILADLVGRKFSPKMLIGSAVMIPFAMFALIQLMLARGKEVSLDYLINSDRGVLLSTFYRTVIPDFQLWNWFTGLGVGYPMHQYITHDSSFTAYLMRLGDGTIYSFCLHIEAIRLLSDFGIIGIFLVGMQLWRNCSIPLLILLVVCMMTNTHIYNFSGALLASTIFNGGRARSRAPQKLNEPVYA